MSVARLKADVNFGGFFLRRVDAVVACESHNLKVVWFESYTRFKQAFWASLCDIILVRALRAYRIKVITGDC